MKSINNAMLSLFILIDYLLTFVGINKLGIIKEGNPFMVWIFEIPLITSFIIVSLIVIIIFLICEKIVISKNYKKAVVFFHIRNFYISYFHIIWIRYYLTS